MTAFTFFNVDPNAQSGANTTAPEIIFFNVLSAWVLREENQTIVSVKPDDEDGWFMLWGIMAFAAFFTGGIALQKIYSHCTDPHRQHGSANAHTEHYLEFGLPEETKEEVVNPVGGAGNPFQAHPPV